jgi:hypothetical protein
MAAPIILAETLAITELYLLFHGTSTGGFLASTEQLE